jgi:hypothetical protein
MLDATGMALDAAVWLVIVSAVRPVPTPMIARPRASGSVRALLAVQSADAEAPRPPDTGAMLLLRFVQRKMKSFLAAAFA